MQLTLNKASKLLGIHRRELKNHVRDGALHIDSEGCIDTYIPQ
jgi:hypothetical protein